MNALPVRSRHTGIATAAGIGVALLAMLGGFPVPASGSPPETCAGQEATIVGTDGDDHDLTGTPGDDVVSLGAGSDRFIGNAGDDVICGGPGSDELFGDDRSAPYDDADRVYGDAGDDTIGGETGPGSDTIDGGRGTDIISFFYSDRGIRVDTGAGTATGEAVDEIGGLEIYLGSDHADLLKGSSRAETLIGVYGEDIVRGRGGDDTVSLREGTITGGPGRDTFAGPDEEAGSIYVHLGRGDDAATLDAMDDGTVRGGPGDDVFAVPGPQTGFDPSGPYAQLLGSRGDDTLTFEGNMRRVRVDVRAHTARLFQSRLTFDGIEEFHGSSRADVLLGSPHADRLRGNGGDDVLRGRRGPDSLRGKAGDDTAYGGQGRDACFAERELSCERP